MTSTLCAVLATLAVMTLPFSDASPLTASVTDDGAMIAYHQTIDAPWLAGLPGDAGGRAGVDVFVQTSLGGVSGGRCAGLAAAKTMTGAVRNLTCDGRVYETVEKDPRGLEHSVTFGAPPYAEIVVSFDAAVEGVARTDVELVVTRAGVALVERTTRAVVFTYEALTVVDATGEVVPSTMVVVDDAAFAVALRCAACSDLPTSAFPLVVDPLSTSTDFYFFTGDGVAGWPEGDGQLFGFDVEVGDFNGDGLLDVAVGAPATEATSGSNDRKGAVFIYHGLTPTTWEDKASRTAFGAPSAGASEGFMGCSIAKGYFDGNSGRHDLVVGAYRETGGTFPNPDGDATLGSNNALRGAWYTITDGASLTGPKNFPGLARRYGGWRTLAADILLEESVDTPIVSMPYDTLDTQGQGYIGVVNKINNLALTELINPLASTTVAKSNDGFFGFELATGDFDADGNPDLVVSATRSWETKVYQGIVQIWYGPISEDSLGGDQPDVRGGIEYLYGSQIGAAFGWSVDSADVNGDSVDDLIVGSPWASATKPDQGSVSVYYGAAAPGRILTGATPDWTYFGDVRDELLGFRVQAVDDLNRDGIADFVVSAPFFGNLRGRVYSFHGKVGGLDQVQGSPDGIVTGPADNDLFGWSMSSGGDFNGDLYSDVAVGGWSHVEQVGAANGTVGRVWLIIGQPLADLDVVMSGDALVEVPATVTFSITVTNNGLEDDSVAFTLVGSPATFELVSSSAGCTQACSSCAITCNLGALNNGAAIPFTITTTTNFNLGSFVHTGSAVSNYVPARLDTDGADAIVTTVATATTDLVLTTATATPSTVETGELVSVFFELFVDPASPSLSVNTILAVDGIPNDISIVSIDTEGSVFGALFVSFGNLLPGARVNATAVLSIPSIPTVSELDLTATALTSSNDTNPSNNVVNLNVPIVVVADMQTVVQASPTNPTAGNEIGFTFIAQNLGGSTAVNVVLNFSLPTADPPAAFAFSSINNGGFACSVVNPAEAAGGGRTNYTCALGNLLAFTAQVVTAFGSIPLAGIPDGTPLLITSTVASSTTDDNMANNYAEVVAPVVSRADLNVFAFASLGTAFTNDALAWSAQVTSVGPSAAVNPTLYFALPIGVTPGAVSVTYSTNFTTPAVACSPAPPANTFVCALAGAMLPSEQFTVRYASTVDPTSPGIITATAFVNSTTVDPRTPDNTDTVSVSIITGSDIWLGTLVAQPTTVCAGQFVSYNFGLVSLGPELATDVVYNQTLPAGTTFQTASTGCSFNPPSTLLCTWTSIPVGETRTGTVLLKVLPDTLGPLFTSAYTTTSSPDYFVANSVKDHTLPLCYQSGLSLVMLGLPGEVAEVSSLFLAATVFNSGPSQARGVAVSVDFPPGSAATTLPGSCAIVSGSVSTGLSALCSLGNVQLAERVQLDFFITVNATVGNITSSAVVTSTTTDLFTADNFASVLTIVVPGSIDLALFVTDTADPILAGAKAIHIYTVFNTGSLDATATTLTVFTNPAAIAGLTPGANPPYCSYAAGRVDCALPAAVASAGGSASVTLTYDTVLAFVGPYSQEATVASPIREVNTADNNATNTQTVESDSDAALIVTTTPNPIHTEAPFNVVSLAIIVNNLGPSLTPDPRVWIHLPPALAYTTVPGGCTLHTATLAECAVGTLARFDQAALTVTATLLPGSPGGGTIISITTNVTQDDSNLSNNVVVSPVTVNDPFVTLSVSASALPPIVAQLDTLSVAFSLSNAGPFIAHNTTFVVDLPPGIDLASAPATTSVSPFGASCAYVSSSSLACNVGNVAPSVVSGLIELVVNASASGDVTLNVTVATVTADVSGPADNVRSLPITITPINADLVLFITDLTGPSDAVLAGAPHTMVFTIFNSGTAVATPVTLVVDVDPTFIASFPSASNPIGCSYAVPRVTCTIASIGAGSSTGLTLSFVTTTSNAGLYTTTANVTTGSLELVLDNNDAVETTTLIRLSDLSVDLFAAPNPVYETNTLILTALVTNVGPSPSVDGATVLDVVLALDTNFVAVAVAGPAGGGVCAYVAGSHSVSCNATALGLGNTMSVAITLVQATEPASNSESFTALVTNPTDSLLANNMDSVVVSVPPAFVALSIDGTASSTLIFQEDSLFLTGTISNLGPALANNVVAVVALPADVSATAFTPAPNCTYSLIPHSLTCSLGTLGIGDTPITLSLATNISASVSQFTVDFSVSTSTFDADLADNFDNVTVAVQLSYIDLSVTITDLTTPIIGGRLHQQIFAIVNAGNKIAKNVYLDVLLPSDALIYADIASSPLCDPAPSPPAPPATTRVGCWLAADLPPAGAATIAISSNALAVTAGTYSTFAAVSSWVNENGYTGNNNATLVSTLSQASDSAIALSSSATTTYASITFDTLVTLSNAGRSVATALTFTVSFPSVVAYQSAAVTTGTSSTLCTPSGSTVTCTVTTAAVHGGLAPGAQPITVALTSVVNAKPPSGLLLINGTSSSTYETVLANNMASVSVTVGDPFADVRLAVQGFPSSVPNVGGVWFYTTTISNLGPFPAEDVVVTIDLPSCFDVDQVPASLANNCSISMANSRATCAIGTVPVGTPLNVAVVGAVNCSLAAGTLQASSNLTTSTIDATDTDNTAFTFVTVVAVNADLALFIADLADPVLSGNLYSASFTVFNTGTAAASGNVLTVDVDSAAIVGFPAGPNPAGCSFSPPTVTCPFPSVGISRVEALTLSFATSPAYEGTFVTTANVSTTTFEVVTTNNAASETTTLQSRADIQALMFASPNPVFETFKLTHSVVINNNGPSPGTGSVATVTIPGASLLSITSVVDGASNCTAMASTPNHVYSCLVQDLAVGQSVTFQFVGTVLPGFVGTVWGNATVVGTRDTFATNDYAQVATTVGVPVVDVVLDLAAVPTTITQEATAFVALTLSNAGPALARDVVARVDAPAGVSLVSLDSLACNETSPSASIHGGPLIHCNFGDVAVGTITVGMSWSTDVPDGVTSIVFNGTASLTSVDTTPTNNAAAAVITVDPSSVDLLLFVDDLADPVTGGAFFQEVFSVFNLGNTEATGVVFTVTYDATRLLMPTGAGCSVVVAGSLSCTLPNIPKGDVAATTVTWSVSRDAPSGDFTVVGAVSSAVLEYVTANNIANETTTLAQRADLSVASGGFPVPVYAEFAYTLSASISASGPSTAHGATLAVSVPPKLRGAPGSFSGVAGFPAVSCSQAGDLASWSCSLGSLPFGAIFDVLFSHVVVANVTAGETLCSTAVVASTVADPAPTDNTDSGCVAIGDPIADLQLSTNIQPPTVPASVTTAVTFFVAVSNRSPFFTSTSIVVDITLPAEVSPGTLLPANCTALTATAIQCLLPNLPKLQATSFSLPLVAAIPTVSTVSISSVVSSAVTDNVPANNAAVTNLDGIPGYADLIVFVNSFTDPVSAGSAYAGAITVFNSGIVTADNVVVRVELLPIMTLFPDSNPSECTLLFGYTVECNASSIAVNDAVSFTLLYITDPVAEGEYYTSAAATTSTLELNTNNNNGSQWVTLERNGDLAVFATSIPAQPARIDILFPLRLLVVVSNAAGPNTALSPSFVSSLPHQTSYISHTSDDAAANCTIVGRTFACQLADILPGVAITTEVVVMVHGGGRMTHNVTIASDNDPIAANNADMWEANDVGFCDADIQITGFLSINPAVALAGENVTLTYLVNNRLGPKSAYNVVAQGSLPDDMVLRAGHSISSSFAGAVCAVTSAPDVRPLTWSCAAPPGEFRLRSEMDVFIPATIDRSSAGGNWTIVAGIAADTCLDSGTANNDISLDIEVFAIVGARSGGATVPASPESSPFPWWLGLIVALLILLCCLLIMFKLGVFKTKSKEDFEKEAEGSSSDSSSSELNSDEILDMAAEDGDDATALVAL